MNYDNNYDLNDSNDLKIQNLIKRIKELQEIVAASKPKLSQEIPIGYTAARWQLALQSFNERLPVVQKYLNLRPEEQGEEFLIEFGPEWDLKCAQNELEELLNKAV